MSFDLVCRECGEPSHPATLGFLATLDARLKHAGNADLWVEI